MKRLRWLLLWALPLAVATGCLARPASVMPDPADRPAVQPSDDASTRKTPLPPPVEPPPQPLPPPQVTIVLVGDIMLERTPGEHVAKGEDPFAGVADVLAEADLAVGNLECVIATVGEPVEKLFNFRCHPRNVAVIASHLDAVSVANNHSGDFGKAAFAEQLDLLKQGGLAYFGGGMNLAEAHTPLIVERNGLKIALLGYNEVEYRSFEAGPETPGLAWSDDEQVVADIRVAREQADLVVVYPHWGWEYQDTPDARQQELARLMIDAGADLVVGAHPHVTQRVEVYKERLIAYSLGNFIFDDFLDVPPYLNEPSRTSWVLRVTMTREGLVDWETLVARTDDRGFPQPLTGVASPCSQGDPAELYACER